MRTKGSTPRHNRALLMGVAMLAGTAVALSAALADTALLAPSDLTYLGAIRLPDVGERPTTFEYSGNAMTFNPAGDRNGKADEFPGSLFLTGHERIAYGDVPDGNQLAEVSIPAPVTSKTLDDLPAATMLQGFSNTLAGRFTTMEELPRVGLAYLDRPETGPKLHLGWGQHFEPEQPAPTHVWFDTDLAPESVHGTWFIANESFYAVNGYMFEIPQDWADRHTAGRPLATGRFRDGGWSGMGPALFAYRPWIDSDGTPASDGAHLEAVTLLRYRSTLETEDVEGTLDGYQHADEWEGGAWITTASGKAAVLFAGTKATGKKYWYGFVNPAGPDMPCVFQDIVDEYTACRTADGASCPTEDLVECTGHDGARGWWSSAFEAQFIFYDPDDLARVTAGEMEAWDPQPYARMGIDSALRLTLEPGTVDWAGSGVQRRQRIGAVAYDRATQLLYVLELYGDGAKPLIHVWRID